MECPNINPLRIVPIDMCVDLVYCVTFDACVGEMMVFRCHPTSSLGRFSKLQTSHTLLCIHAREAFINRKWDYAILAGYYRCGYGVLELSVS